MAEVTTLLHQVAWPSDRCCEWGYGAGFWPDPLPDAPALAIRLRAAHMELALSEGLPVATLDDKLQPAAVAGIALVSV